MSIAHPVVTPVTAIYSNFSSLLPNTIKKIAEVYTPDKHLAIDESLVHFKDRLHFHQYLPNKWARYGVKLYKL